MATTKSKLLIGLTLVSLSSIGLAYGPQWGGGPGYGPGNRMAQELNLTTEQQDKVKTIMQKHREEGQAWREKHHKELETKLGDVLSAEQLETFKSFKQQGPRGRGMGPGGQGPYGKGMGGGYGRGQGPCGMKPY